MPTGFALPSPLAHEGDARIEKSVKEGVAETLVFALRAEADPGQHLRRTAEATAKAAIGTVKRVVDFAWLRAQRRMAPSARRSSKVQGTLACGTTFQQKPLPTR